MRKKLFVGSAALVIIASGLSAFSQTPDPDVQMVREVMHNADGYYHCDKIVHGVNRLRALGKDRALGILQQLLPDQDSRNTSFTIELTCRLLFVNPDGWKMPRLGAPHPIMNLKAEAKYPLFPFALSDDVPFLLVQGYAGGGRGPPPQAILDQCRKFSIIDHDLPLTGYDKAAHDLIDSPLFKEICEVDGKPDAKALAYMTDLIMREAQVAADDCSATLPTTNPMPAAITP